MTNKSDRLSNIAFIGVGGCGVTMLESWLDKLPNNALCVAIDRGERYFYKKTKFKNKIALLNVKSINSTVEYSESVISEVQASIDEQMPKLTVMLQDMNRVVILAGLGGVIGSWASQIICNRLIAMNKQVVTVLVMPFSFTREAVKVADFALPRFDGAAHRVLCFNDYLIKNTPKHISLEESLKIMNEKTFELLVRAS